MMHTEAADLDPGLPAVGAQHAQDPKQRLAASRESIRRALLKAKAPPDPHQAADGPREPGWLGTLGDALSDLPAAAIAVRWLRRWWNGHPWRTTFEFARDAAQELAVPVARKHPWWLVGGALVAGMLLARAKPWRLLSGGALLAGLLPRFDLGSIMNWVNLAIADLNGRVGPAQQPTPSPVPAPPPPSAAAEPAAKPVTPMTDGVRGTLH